MKEENFSDLLNSSDPLGEVLDALRKRQFTLRDADVSSRVHNHWHTMGLVDGGETRQALYDFPQYLWLKLIQELRTFGMPIEGILAVKEFLYIRTDPAQGHEALREGILDTLIPGTSHLTPAQKKEYEELKKLPDQPSGPELPPTMLETVLGWQLVFRTPSSLVVVPGQRPFLWSEDIAQATPQLRERLERPHLMLPFAHLILEFISDESKEHFLGKVPVLSREETQVLHALRDRQVRELTVMFVEQGGTRRMDLVTKTDQVITPEQVRQVSGILGLGKYSSVTLKTNKGTQLSFERSDRRRL